MSNNLFLVSMVAIAAAISGCSDSKTPSSSVARPSSAPSSSNQYDQDTKAVARLYGTTEQRANSVASQAAALGGTSNEKMMEALRAARGE